VPQRGMQSNPCCRCAQCCRRFRSCKRSSSSKRIWRMI
jgi:hypothetical protein